MKAFTYVNPTNEKDAVAALSPQFEQAIPIGGGQDLLARMKDYVTQPDRIVNVKSALESTVTPSGGGLRIGAAMKMVDLAEHPEVLRMYPAIGAAAIEVGTPQIRNQAYRGRQPQSAAPLLVLPQRRVRLFQERREHVLLAGRRKPVPRDLRSRTKLHRAPVESCGSDGRLWRNVPSCRSQG